MRDNLVIIEGTKFIYKTNFSGDPDRETLMEILREKGI